MQCILQFELTIMKMNIHNAVMGDVCVCPAAHDHVYCRHMLTLQAARAVKILPAGINTM